MKNTALSQLHVNSYGTSLFLRACDWGNEESRIVITYLIKCLETKSNICKTSLLSSTLFGEMNRKLVCISETIHLMSIGHCFSKRNKCCHPSETKKKKEIQNQESVCAKTWYLHGCRNQRYQGYIINLAFVQAVKTTKTCFREIVFSLRCDHL